MNDINTLMSRIDEINRTDSKSLTDTDIATLIAFHRRARARKAAGEKAERPTRPTIDLSAILNLPVAKPASNIPAITRRI